MEFVFEFGLFLAKTLTIVVAIVVIISAAAGAAMRKQGKSHEKGDLVVEHLNESLDDTRDYMMANVLSKKDYKAWSKSDQAKKKEENKKAEHVRKEASKHKSASTVEQDGAKAFDKGSVVTGGEKNKLFVLSFDGDVQATETEQLIRTIDAGLLIARPGDEFVCCLESPGGLVHAYGLASSQLRRIRDAGFPLTVCIDKVAASGGYMMACVADKIIAAPFSIIGSIGVVAQIPNFNKVLKKHDVDIELHTAGEYKRTLTLFGENTDSAREKFREDLEDTHVLFKEFVSTNRPVVDISSVATGEHWYGEQAIGLKLVDEISTSQTYLMKAVKTFDVYTLDYELKVPLVERLGLSAAKACSRILAQMGVKSVPV